MRLDDVAATGLVQNGSRISYALLAAGEREAVAAFEQSITPRLGRGESLQSLTHARPEIRSTLDRAAQFVNLAAMLAVILAAVAIALGTRHYLRRHLDGYAVMRCMGATQRRLLVLLLVEFALLGVIASGLGALGGYLGQAVIVGLVAELVKVPLPAPSLLPAVQGCAIGIVLLLGFALPPLLQLKGVPALRVLLRAALRNEDEQALGRAHTTLERMAGGGMYDHVEGGFFRYSTTRDWSVPHFEKMSEDHGGLLQVLADLARVSEEDRVIAEHIVEPTIAYLDRTLSMIEGGFAGSQDADEAYFALDAAGRARQDPPYVDPRVYTSWTAGLARGYFACGIAFERHDWIERGRRAIDFLWSRLRAGEAGMYQIGRAHV